MQGDFEKKVQEKMEELRLTPTAPVWEKIELQIQPEKRRRRVIFWLFFAALLAGGWWFLSNRSWPEEKPVADATAANDSAGHSATTSPGERTKARLKQTAVHRSTAQSGSLQSKASVGNASLATKVKNRTVPLQSGSSMVPMIQGSFSAVAARKKAVEEANHTRPVLGQMETRQEANVKAQVAAGSTETVSGTTTVNNAKEKDNLRREKAVDNSTLAVPPVPDSAKKKAAVVQKKWTNKIRFGAGMSSFVSAGAAGNLSASPSQSNVGSSSGSSPVPPQKATTGFAFSLGYAKEKQLASRLAFSIGVQYSFYSTKQKVGGFKNSPATMQFRADAVNVSGYYSNASSRSDSAMTYTNRVHMAELPVSLTYRLLKRTPLSLQAGASYGRLLRSNVLTYDPASGVYYTNKQNNRKNFVNLFAALQYAVIGQQNWTLNIGPAIQYNLVSLQKISDGKPHLLFAGIKGSLEF